jgi:hypothetical protein
LPFVDHSNRSYSNLMQISLDALEQLHLEQRVREQQIRKVVADNCAPPSGAASRSDCSDAPAA